MERSNQKVFGIRKSLVVGVAGAAVLFASGALKAQQLPDKIKLGILEAMTGPAAGGAAQGSMPAYKLAIKELMDSGGKLAGRPVEVVYADNASDPTQTTNEARRLATREGIHIALGPNITGLNMAAAPVFAQSKIVSIGVAAGSSFTPQVAPYVFVDFYNSKSYSGAIANYLADTLKVKSVALLAGDGATDKAVLQDMRAALTAKGVTITGEQQHETRAADMTPQLLALRRGNPEILFEQSSVVEDGATMLRNMNEIGWKVPLMSTAAGFLGTFWMRINGPDVFTKNKIYAMTYKAMTACKNDPIGQTPYAKFVARLKAFDPDNASKFNFPSAAQSYDSAKLLFAAVDATKSVNGDVLRDWIRKNGSKFAAVSGEMQDTNETTQVLFGVNAIGFIERPDLLRADGTLPRAGC